MHVLVVTDNFAPERNAPAIRTHEHCLRWVKAGVAVTVVTSAPNFPTGRVLSPYENRLYQRQTLDGIDVVRVWTFLAPNQAMLRRSLDFASFGVTSLLAGLFQKADVIVATSPQLLAGLSGCLLAFAKRKPWLLEVRDLWPDSVVSLEVAQEDHLVVRLLRMVERMLYRSAARIVTTNEGLRDRLVERGVDAAKIGVVPNGADASRFTPRPRPDALVDELGLKGRFVVGYIGTLGIAHDVDSVVAAAKALKGGDTAFLFVGDGARYAPLAREIKAQGLDNCRLLHTVPPEQVPDHIACCDVLLVPLKRTDTLADTMPSKIFEIAAMERPIIVGAEGIAADLVTSYRAGLAVPPEDPQALTAAIQRLKNKPGLGLAFAPGARRLAADYSRDKLAAQMLEEIRKAARGRR
jgi:glycosyltransferase involved in cell wall biosynthesis